MGKQSSSSFVLCLFTLLHLPVLQSMGGKKLKKKKSHKQTNKHTKTMTLLLEGRKGLG